LLHIFVNPIHAAVRVRSGEELNRAALADYLQQKPAGGRVRHPSGAVPQWPLQPRLSGSNGPREYVLRRPPLGPVAPKAHDMAREYRVLDAVHPHFPEAPQVFLLCEDPAVIGGTFFPDGAAARGGDSRFDPARVGRDSRIIRGR
jgi:aminoglycoside phosphotransferase (APT) family kinase protein